MDNAAIKGMAGEENYILLYNRTHSLHRTSAGYLFLYIILLLSLMIQSNVMISWAKGQSYNTLVD